MKVYLSLYEFKALGLSYLRVKFGLDSCTSKSCMIETFFDKIQISRRPAVTWVMADVTFLGNGHSANQPSFWGIPTCFDDVANIDR